MKKANVYLLFNGNCEEAFNYYKAVFQTEFLAFSRFGDFAPGSGQAPNPADKEKIMHVALPIGDSVLMGSDGGSDWSKYHVQGNNFSVSVSVESEDEVNRLFEELVQNGKTDMPVQQTFWGEYFGMLTDQFGIKWMIGYRPEQSN